MCGVLLVSGCPRAVLRKFGPDWGGGYVWCSEENVSQCGMQFPVSQAASMRDALDPLIARKGRKGKLNLACPNRADGSVGAALCQARLSWLTRACRPSKTRALINSH